MNVRTVFGLASALAFAGCAGPSAAQKQEQARVAHLMMTASAVHLPPAGVDSCVGVTVRLTDPSGAGEAERKTTEVFILESEVVAAFTAAGLPECEQAYLLGLEDAGLEAEALALTVGFGVDPAGRVCAVVERTPPDPIDPAAGPLVELAASCLKDVLFAARLPAGRVEDKERVVRFFSWSVRPEGAAVATSSVAAGG